jgi:hypothetical protein
MSSAQLVEPLTTTIRATNRSIGVRRTRFLLSERDTALSQKYEFGFIDAEPSHRDDPDLPREPGGPRPVVADHGPRSGELTGFSALSYFFKFARKLGVAIMPICACLETIVALPGEPEAP